MEDNFIIRTLKKKKHENDVNHPPFPTPSEPVLALINSIFCMGIVHTIKFMRRMNAWL